MNLIKFRPLRIGNNLTIIGDVHYRGFEPIGIDLYAPVYKKEQKYEFNRVYAESLEESLAKKAQLWGKHTLEMLINAECEFFIKERKRFKSNHEKDIFGKHSNNLLAEVYYRRPGELMKNLNDDILEYLKNNQNGN